ncbi:hypothetical protein [uncultured Rhodoferax sp.]|uniref:hypothetical protein n=1 Tax=uncultured Rhodoferax sp. TaxID=223188 RepID=UPI0025D58DEE|nr:hypothetical protein [uncultured Rhodoferax sp.]
MPNAQPPKKSTSQIRATKFTQHGVVDIWTEGAFVHYEASGPFNIELMDCLAIAQRDYLLANRPQGRWVSICTLLDNAMTSPDAMARFAEVMTAPKPYNMLPVATAFVIAPDVEGGVIMAPLFAKIYIGIGRPFQIFETMPAAKLWAESMLGQAGTD